MILAQQAARKFPSPPSPDQQKPEPDSRIDDDDLIFATKVMTSATTTEKCKEKLLSKMDECEIQLQLYILMIVDQLNEMLIGKKPADLFSNISCKAKYAQLKQLQRSQQFCSVGWKVVSYPVLVPMTEAIRIFVSPVFHTRNLQVFQNWSLNDFHCDMNLSPNLENEFVDQQERVLLDEFVPHEIFVNPDWPKSNDLEKSPESEVKSIDTETAAKISRALFNDSVGINSDVSECSLLDFSYVGLKPKSQGQIQNQKRSNLSRVDQLKILESGSEFVQSTPRRRSYSTGNRPASPLSKGPNRSLSKNLKRCEKPRVTNEGYVAQFLNKWFRNNMSDLTNDLKSEMERMENN